MGVAPTFKQLAVTGISIYRFSEGKIAEIWISWDRLSLMQQLGVVTSFSSKI
jgi:predicted ester cyclase